MKTSGVSIDVLIVTVWLLQPIVWQVLLKAAGLSWLRFSIPTTLAGFAIIFQYIGLPILYFKLDDYRAEFVYDNDLIVSVFLLTSFSISALLCGFVLGKFLLGRLEFHSKLIPEKYSKKKEFLYLLALLSIGIAFFVSYVEKIGFDNVPFLIAAGFADESTSLGALRSNATNAFEGKYHWYRLFMIDVVSFTCYSFYARYLAHTSKMGLVVFLLSAVVALFTSVMSTEKAPVLYLIIGLAMTHALVRRSGSYNIRAMVYGVMILGLFASVLYVTFMGSNDVVSGLGHVASRVFTGAIQPLYHYLEVFPEKEGFLIGRSFPNPLGILPFDQYSLTVEMMNIIYPGARLGGVVGTMPAAFWGEVYANFGALVAVFLALLVGFLVYGFSLILNGLKKYPVIIGGGVWLALHIKDLAVTSLSGYMVDIYLAIIFVLMIIGSYLARHDLRHHDELKGVKI